jgi:hypothetical protein
MPTLRETIKRLSDRWLLAASDSVSVKDLNQRFPPVQSGSLRSLLLRLNALADEAKPIGGGFRPYYYRHKPTIILPIDHGRGTEFIDLTNIHLPSYGPFNTVAEAVRLFDARAGAAVHAAIHSMRDHYFKELLELKIHGGDKDPDSEIPDAWIIRANALAVIAFPDYVIPGTIFSGFRGIVSQAILASNPGWCGTFGPSVDDTSDIRGDPSEGNYDMSQMHLLQIAYRYYGELSPEAREHLIIRLLATGTIHRPNRNDIVTSGGAPNDWSTAGFADLPFIIPFLKIRFLRIGETENHILTIHTARYLTNQLLYQRDHNLNHDNRRNGAEDTPTCTELMLSLLRNILRGDFSEYNAKSYQTETRYALLNLCSYAYDHEVRLAARMVLDYVSAHIAISSNDLRRMVPFRRKNEGKNVKRNLGFMDLSLVETTFGADPMAQHFMMLAGNTRIYETRGWHIKTDGTDGNDAVMYALSDYRLPPSIHDLFVNDQHRRFFQRLHRLPQDDPEVTGRNCDNHEI